MSPERWQRVDDIFGRALERGPGERARFLEEECAGDAELRADVEAMLAADSKLGEGSEAGDFMAEPAAKLAAGMIAEGRAGAMAGRRVGRYEIVSPLGAGGMGEVYLAKDSRNGRRVALKLLPEYFTGDAERVRRFEQEARAALALSHPNIVTIYEIGEDAGARFIASEFVNGVTLRRRMAAGPLKLGEALGVATQIASALAGAHGEGIVHRDIKPENVMVRPDGYVKVLDFSIAKLGKNYDDAARPGAAVLTRPGVVMGTVAYMSPEQARGVGVDERTDIWSLGCVLYEMIAGRAPFEGETPSDVMAAVLEREPPPLARYARGVPEQLEGIVSMALAKNRDERYHTATQMLGALTRLKQRLDAEAQLGHVLTRERPPTGERAIASDSNLVAPSIRSGEQSVSDAAATPTLPQPPTHATSAEYIVGEIKRHKLGVGLSLALLFALAVAAVVGLYKLAARRDAASPPQLQSMEIKRLTSSGRAAGAAVSPDGRYVVYEEAESDGRQGLWLKQLATGTTLQIVAPDRVGYRGASFSRDGNLIYYTVTGAPYPSGALFQVPVIGGPAKKLLEGISGAASPSPDGSRLAFVYHRPDADSLMTANADGSQARQLAVRKPSEFFSVQGPAWSPDGKTIACGGTRTVSGYYANVFTVNADTGETRQLTSQQWKAVRRVEWAGAGALVVLANDAHQEYSQIWEVSYPAGEARRVTNDLNGHGDTSLGLTADAKTLVMAQEEHVANLWLARVGTDAAEARQLTTGVGRHDGVNGISWLPDGDLLYTSTINGVWDVWRIRPDGTGQRQLTDDAYEESFPVPTADGRFVVFKGAREDGTSHLWRVSLDGGRPEQLTAGEDHSERLSPDGRWIVYSSRTDGREMLWRVAADGGPPVKLTDYVSQWPDVSPDGRQIACAILDERAEPARWRMALVPFDGGPPLALIDLPPTADLRVHWTPDGRALAYIDTVAGVSNVWAHPLAGGPPKQLTNFTSGQIFGFEFSRDGRQIALSRGARTSDIVLIRDFR